MAVKLLNSANFDQEINDTKVVIVDFFADWCGPCKRMAPALEELSNERADIKICKINVDEANDVAYKYGVSSIPCFISFKNGEVYKRIVGARPKEDLLTLAE